MPIIRWGAGKPAQFKRRSDGSINNRYLLEQQATQEQKKEYKELQHTYRHLTAKEIAAQYPPEKVDDLLTKAEQTRQALTLPPDLPGFLGVE